MCLYNVLIRQRAFTTLYKNVKTEYKVKHANLFKSVCFSISGNCATFYNKKMDVSFIRNHRPNVKKGRIKGGFHSNLLIVFSLPYKANV